MSADLNDTYCESMEYYLQSHRRGRWLYIEKKTSVVEQISYAASQAALSKLHLENISIWFAQLRVSTS